MCPSNICVWGDNQNQSVSPTKCVGNGGEVMGWGNGGEVIGEAMEWSNGVR